MRVIILVAALLSCWPVEADQLLLGLITAHTFNVDSTATNYEGCLHESCETIINPLLAYRHIKYANNGLEYDAVTVFGGLNSVHGPMAGAAYSFGVVRRTWNLGVLQGLYVQDNAHYRQQGVEPFYVVETQNAGLVPLLGIEAQKYVTGNLFVNTLVTPILVNIGIGWEL